MRNFKDLSLVVNIVFQWRKPFSSFRKEKLVTAVKTMDDTLLDCDDVEKLFTLLTKKKYLTHERINFQMLRYVLGG